jgi:hypothetical protein
MDVWGIDSMEYHKFFGQKMHDPFSDKNLQNMKFYKEVFLQADNFKSKIVISS